MLAEEEQESRKSYKWIIIGGVAALAIALLVFHFAVKPLDIMWYILLRKLGIG
jgi:uncharacterized membrane protein